MCASLLHSVSWMHGMLVAEKCLDTVCWKNLYRNIKSVVAIIFHQVKKIATIATIATHEFNITAKIRLEIAMALTPKQQKFVEEYLKDLNATQAAIRAGYSVKNAFKIGSETLQKTTVKQAIEGAISKRNKRSEITQDRVLEELALFAFGDVQDTAAWGKGGLPAKDKLKALELLMRHMGMMTDKVDIKGSVDLNVITPAVRQKLDEIYRKAKGE